MCKAIPSFTKADTIQGERGGSKNREMEPRDLSRGVALLQLAVVHQLAEVDGSALGDILGLDARFFGGGHRV